MIGCLDADGGERLARPQLARALRSALRAHHVRTVSYAARCA